MDNIDYPCRTALHLDSNRYVAVRHMVECNDGVTYLAASHASPAIAQAVGGGAPAVGGASAVLGPRCRWSKQLKRKVCDGDGLELGGMGEAPAAAPGVGALVIDEARAADAAPEEVAPPALGWRPWKDKKAGKPRARPAATDLDAGPGARPAQASAPADAAAAAAAAGGRDTSAGLFSFISAGAAADASPRPDAAAGAAAAAGAGAGASPHLRGHAALAAATALELAAAVPDCRGTTRDGTSALPGRDAVGA